VSAPRGLCSACLISSLFDPLDDGSEEPVEMPAPAAPAERVGHYELLEQLGRGGMGVVFRARDTRLNRIVALKLILTGKLASDSEVKRFRTEAEAAAHLEHPNIVPIYEVGESEGRHFFAMKLMEGGSLAEWNSPCAADLKPTSTQGIAALAAKLSRAVHHAHQRGILHRDLKPANILLDTQGEPAVTDFGLARRLEIDSALTLSGTALGSPSYMAPEQAAGRSREVTTAADVYSLGAILYELLAGCPPFAGDTPLETMRRVVEDEPVPPSVIRSRRRSGVRIPKSESRPGGDTSVPKPNPADVPHSDFGFRASDLEVICLKCLQKEPSRRYASAAALAEDLERFVRGEPVQARPIGPHERLWRWMKRHPAWAMLAGASLTALMGFMALQQVNETSLKRERDHARMQESAARTSEQITRQNLYAADMFLAHRAIEEGNVASARRTLEAHRPKPGEEDLRGFEWRYLWKRCEGQQLHVLRGFSNVVTSVAFSPDGRWLAASGGRTVRWWNATNQQLAATLAHDPNSVVRSVCFAPDGETLWTGDSKGKVRVWLPDGERVGLITRGTGVVHIAAPAASAGRVAFGERSRSDGKASGAVALYGLLDVLARNERGNLLTNSGGLAAFSRDGKLLVTGGGQCPVLLWNLATGENKRLLGEGFEVTALAISPDGANVAVCTYNSFGLTLIETATGRTAWIHRDGLGTLGAPAFAPDGGTLALPCADHTVLLLDMPGGRESRRLVGHRAEVLAAAFSPDGQTLASCGKDRTVRLWNLSRKTEADALTFALQPFVFSPDGRTLTAAIGDGWPRKFGHYDVATLQAKAGPEISLQAGRYPLSGNADNGAPLRWLLHGGATPDQWAKFEDFIVAHTNWTRVGCSDNGAVIALGFKNGVVKLWDNFNSARLPDIPTKERGLTCLALTHDGRTLVSVGRSNVVAVWDVMKGANRLRLPAGDSAVMSLVFSLDGQLLAAGHEDSTIQVWDATSGTPRAVLVGHNVGVHDLAFSPDGRTLLSAADSTLKLWHVATWREVATLTRSGPGSHPIFSSTGLLTSHWNGAARLWRAPSLEEIDREADEQSPDR
jgi:serine/threonine protein kinase/dipeptidyl aminopeptidase/acylaminoacyl peptidase